MFENFASRRKVRVRLAMSGEGQTSWTPLTYEHWLPLDSQSDRDYTWWSQEASSILRHNNRSGIRCAPDGSLSVR